MEPGKIEQNKFIFGANLKCSIKIGHRLADLAKLSLQDGSVDEALHISRLYLQLLFGDGESISGLASAAVNVEQRLPWRRLARLARHFIPENAHGPFHVSFRRI